MHYSCYLSRFAILDFRRNDVKTSHKFNGSFSLILKCDMKVTYDMKDMFTPLKKKLLFLLYNH